MKKLLLLMVFFLIGPHLIKADEVSNDDQDIINQLNTLKSPFEDGIPKPVVIVPPVKKVVPKPTTILKPIVKPKPLPPPVTLPFLDLQGVIVGEEIFQAIINDQVVPLQGTIEGAKVVSVSKEGVELLYKGKKFVLKVD